RRVLSPLQSKPRPLHLPQIPSAPIPKTPFPVDPRPRLLLSPVSPPGPAARISFQSFSRASSLSQQRVPSNPLRLFRRLSTVRKATDCPPSWQVYSSRADSVAWFWFGMSEIALHIGDNSAHALLDGEQRGLDRKLSRLRFLIGG